MSFVDVCRCSPLGKMCWVYSLWSSVSAPVMLSMGTSEKPVTEFSGVRSSCDIVARNSDFRRAASSAALTDVSLTTSALRASRCRRALSIAFAAWLARSYAKTQTATPSWESACVLTNGIPHTT